MFYKAKWLRWSNDCVRGGDCRKTTLNYIRFLPLGNFFLDEFFFPLTSSVLHLLFCFVFFFFLISLVVLQKNRRLLHLQSSRVVVFTS